MASLQPDTPIAARSAAKRGRRSRRNAVVSVGADLIRLGFSLDDALEYLRVLNEARRRSLATFAGRSHTEATRRKIAETQRRKAFRRDGRGRFAGG